MAGGVFFRVAEQLFFLPATIASKVLPMPRVGYMPGAPEELLGIALVQSEMVPVVALARGESDTKWPATGRLRIDSRPMLLCNYLGERIGLVGFEIVATGNFDDPEPTYGGVKAQLFDIDSVIERLRRNRWAV